MKARAIVLIPRIWGEQKITCGEYKDVTLRILFWCQYMIARNSSLLGRERLGEKMHHFRKMSECHSRKIYKKMEMTVG